MRKKKSLPTPVVPAPKSWETMATKDIRYESISYLELMQWVMNNVPQGTDMKDIKFQFDVDYNQGYYDEFTIDAEMQLQVYK